MASRSPTRIGRRRERATSDAKCPPPPGLVPAPTSPAAPDVQPVVNAEFTTGSPDLTLVSSDGVVFQLDSYFLLAHRWVLLRIKSCLAHSSVIFRVLLSQLETSSTGIKSIRFDDPILEHSSVISLFLETACQPYRDSFAVQVREGQFTIGGICEKAFRLAGKYDCPFVQQSMLRSVIHCLTMEPYYLNPAEAVSPSGKLSAEGSKTTETTERRPRVDVVLAFVLAAEQKMTGECVQLVLALQARHPHREAGGLHALHPSRFTKDLAKRVPFDTFWALQTAYAGVSETATSTGTKVHEGVVARFVSALTDNARSIRETKKQEKTESTTQQAAPVKEGDGETVVPAVDGAKKPPTVTSKPHKSRGLFASFRRPKEPAVSEV